MIDHSFSNQVLNIAFEKLGNSETIVDFPKEGTLSAHVAELIEQNSRNISDDRAILFASASVEMWQRAVHSFLWSVALKDYSKLWSSVTGYYASHFVMRAFAHAFGFFKSFSGKKVAQLAMGGDHFVLSLLDEKDRGEHIFYWKVVKRHPEFEHNPLFRLNNVGDRTSDCSHRNFANYTDHIGNFVTLGFPKTERLVDSISKISHIRRFSITEVYRDDYPDLDNVQILAYQRIVTFRDFLDNHVSDNRFWKAHREPSWCKGIMSFELQDADVNTLGRATE